LNKAEERIILKLRFEIHEETLNEIEINKISKITK